VAGGYKGKAISYRGKKSRIGSTREPFIVIFKRPSLALSSFLALIITKIAFLGVVQPACGVKESAPRDHLFL
jgi:hypothetical protein